MAIQQHNLSWNTLDAGPNHSNTANQIPSSAQSHAHPSILNQQHSQHPLQASSSQGLILLIYFCTPLNLFFSNQFSSISLARVKILIGFQSYSGIGSLKPGQASMVKNSSTPEPISLKT